MKEEAVLTLYLLIVEGYPSLRGFTKAVSQKTTGAVTQVKARSICSDSLATKVDTLNSGKTLTVTEL